MYFLIAYFLSYSSAKNYQNLFLFFEVVTSHSCDMFRHTVCVCCAVSESG